MVRHSVTFCLNFLQNQEENKQQIEDLKKLMPLNAFQKMMEDSSEIWKYPIDNEAGRL